MSIRMVLAAVVLAFVAGVTAPNAVTGGGSTGEVVFELTIQGPMPSDEGFFLVVECADDVPLCDDVVICIAEPWIDTPRCGETPTTVTSSGEISPQTIEWQLFRAWNVTPTTKAERTLVLSGTWTVHTGRQVISLGYVYPDPDAAPALPDTAMAPRD